jgi:hypothetical protein
MAAQTAPHEGIRLLTIESLDALAAPAPAR